MTSLEPKKMKLYAPQIVFLGPQNNDFSKLTKCHLFLPKILQPKGSKMTSLVLQNDIFSAKKWRR